MSDTINLSTLVRLSVVKIGKWAATVAFVGGAVSDILNPLGPFAGYIAVIALVAAVVLLLGLLLRLVPLEKGVPAFAFAVMSCVVAGGLYSLQKSQDAENGIIAELVPAVSQFQQSLGIVARQVEEIDRKVTENLDTTRDVKETAENIERQNKDIAAAVEDIAAGFKALANQGGIIANPERPDQFYHNARVHELGGDILNARQSYLGFVRFNVDAVDPYERFATLLKVSEGKAGAREVLGALRETNKTPSMELAWLQLGDDTTRVARIGEFIAKNPEFGPAYYALADEYSEDRLGARSLADKKAEADALNKFLGFEKEGKLVKYFVDQTLLAERSDRARSRLAAIGDLNRVAEPTLEPTRANNAWLVKVGLPEPATQIFWRAGPEGAFADTGKLAENDAATGQQKVNPIFSLPSDTGPTGIFIKYTDVRGREVGPFEVRFEPSGALASSQRSIIDQLSVGWMEFQPGGELYFTSLVIYRCGIKEVRYGFNGAPPEKRIDLPACDEANPNTMPSDFTPFMKVGKDVKTVSVEVTYPDGTKSGVKEFRRP